MTNTSIPIELSTTCDQLENVSSRYKMLLWAMSIGGLSVVGHWVMVGLQIGFNGAHGTILALQCSIFCATLGLNSTLQQHVVAMRRLINQINTQQHTD